MSGITGIESIPGPQLPQIDFLNRFNGLNFQTILNMVSIFVNLNLMKLTLDWIHITEENQKKYAENDARFRSSPLVKKLLEQSERNKEK